MPTSRLYHGASPASHITAVFEDIRNDYLWEVRYAVDVEETLYGVLSRQDWYAYAVTYLLGA